MGFWGSVYVARTAQALGGLPSVRTLGGEADLDVAGADGWWLLRLHRPEYADERTLAAIAREAGGPLLCADVLDSDTAMVRLVDLAPDPDVEPVEFYLNTASARGYGLPVEDETQAAAPAAVLAWAGGGDPAAVEEAVRHEAVFAEDAVMALAAAFGAVPAGELGEWTFGDDD